MIPRAVQLPGRTLTGISPAEPHSVLVRLYHCQDNRLIVVVTFFCTGRLVHRRTHVEIVPHLLLPKEIVTNRNKQDNDGARIVSTANALWRTVVRGSPIGWRPKTTMPKDKKSTTNRIPTTTMLKVNNHQPETNNNNAEGPSLHAFTYCMEDHCQFFHLS
jgi:hypothetical protein